MKRCVLVLLATVAAFSAAPAFARSCAITVEANDRMQFAQPEVRVPADCSEVNLTLKHTGKMPATAMGHNWVLTRTADVPAVATAGTRASAADSYLPKGDARVLAFTPVIGGGQSTQIKFSTARLTRGGDYSFFCSFPGHWSMMKGKFTFG